MAIRHGIVVLGCGIAAVLDQAMWMKDEDLNRSRGDVVVDVPRMGRTQTD